jgi:HAD superfamily hydrolase (TIGR01509 family)
MPPNYDAVLFDLDGTLWHFDDAPPPEEIAAALAPGLERVITGWGQHSTIPYDALDLAIIGGFRLSDEAADEIHQHRHPDRVADVINTLAVHRVAATREQAQQLLDAFLAYPALLRPRLFDGALEAIEDLRSTGVLLATATNRSHTAAQITDELRYHNLAHHFDEVLTAGDVGWFKPHPAIIHAALEALDVPPERALMVGDEPRRDIAAARAAGVTSVLIAHPGRPSATPAAADEQPHHTIESLSELLDPLH